MPHGGEGKRLHRDAEPRQRLHRAPVLRRGLRQDEIRLHRQDRFGLRIVVAPDPGKVALARVVVEARDAGEALSGAEGEHDLRQRRGHRHHPPDLGGHRRAEMLPWPRREQQGNKQHQRTVQQTLPAPQVLVIATRLLVSRLLTMTWSSSRG